MVDDGVLGKVFSLATAAWGALLLNAVALFKAWPHIMARRNERQRDIASEKASDWDRIRAERDNAFAERDRIHALWIECEEERVQLLARAVAAEATLLGLGNARQREAERVAADRIADAAKKGGGAE